MANKNDLSLIILTYKNKVLLRLHNTDPLALSIQSNSKKNVWSFLSVSREKNKTLKTSIIAKVERETGIKLDGATLLLDSVTDVNNKHFFHASLNDDNVNSMHREDGETLQFFALKELTQLNLTVSTKSFIENNSSMIQGL